MIQRVLAMGCTFVIASPALVAGLEPCESSCAVVRVGQDGAFPGGTVEIALSFEQGPDDGTPSEGNDDVAALAFTLGIPGNGEQEAPLRFSEADCRDDNGDGLPDGVTVGGAIRDDFRVVIENAECQDGECGCGASRNRCACPGAGEDRDDFINIVVFGPKVLPDVGPVAIPILPYSAELLRLRLTVAADAAIGDIPVHIFAETDDEGTIPKPQFAAHLSVGDQSAIDQTADRGADRSKVRTVDGRVTVLPPPSDCAGDCDLSQTVEINELITGVNIALGSASAAACSEFDLDQNGFVEIDELVAAVNNSLNGCP